MRNEDPTAWLHEPDAPRIPSAPMSFVRAPRADPSARRRVDPDDETSGFPPADVVPKQEDRVAAVLAPLPPVAHDQVVDHKPLRSTPRTLDTLLAADPMLRARLLREARRPVDRRTSRSVDDFAAALRNLVHLIAAPADDARPSARYSPRPMPHQSPRRKKTSSDDVAGARRRRGHAPRTEVMRAVAELVPYAKNARTHSKEQVAQLAASIERFGWTSPVLVDDEGTRRGRK